MSDLVCETWLWIYFIHYGIHYVMMGKVRQLNDQLQAMFAPNVSDSVRLWKHRGLGNPGLLPPNGFHLKNTGNRWLIHSISGAIK